MTTNREEKADEKMMVETTHNISLIQIIIGLIITGLGIVLVLKGLGISFF